MINCPKKSDNETYLENIVSVEDLKLLLKFNNIQTNLSDNELNQLIIITQRNMLAELGITLNPVQHIYTVYPNYTEPRKQTRVPITLPITNVKQIDEIKINNKLLVEEVDYDFDEMNSIVYLKPRHQHGVWRWWWFWYWDIALSVRIKYTTQFNDGLILDLLNSLLGDLLVYNLTPSTQRGVKSITEGDVTVGYHTDSKDSYTLPKIIADKKNNILNLLNNTKVMMI